MKIKFSLPFLLAAGTAAFLPAAGCNREEAATTASAPAAAAPAAAAPVAQAGTSAAPNPRQQIDSNSKIPAAAKSAINGAVPPR